MRFPHDEKKLREFQDALVGKVFEAVMPELSQQQKAIGIPFAFELGKTAASYDTLSSESLRKVKLYATRGAPAMLPGQIAGDILLLALLAWAQGKRTGRTAIYKAIAGTSDRSGSIRTLQTVWHDYGCVAHLWAAFLVMRGIPEDQEGFINFLSIAEFLRRWATTYFPDRAKEPIMDPATARAISGDFLRVVGLRLSSLQPSNEALGRLNLSSTVIFTCERTLFTCEK